MSITQKAFNEFITSATNKFNLEKSEFKDFADKFFSKNNVVSKLPLTPVAKKLAILKDIDILKVTSADGIKITIDDVRRFIGDPEDPPKAKATDLFTPKARALAKVETLKVSQFGPSERTGNPRKSGEATITLQDVYRKLRSLDPKYKLPDSAIKISPGTAKFAETENVDLMKVTGTGSGGRILKADLEQYIKNKVDSDSSEVEKEDKKVPKDTKSKQYKTPK